MSCAVWRELAEPLRDRTGVCNQHEIFDSKLSNLGAAQVICLSGGETSLHYKAQRVVQLLDVGRHRSGDHDGDISKVPFERMCALGHGGTKHQ